MTTNDAPFRFSQEGNLSILTLLPELNKVQWGEIDAIGTKVLSALESQSQPQLIVDLTPLNYMGSAMVALIVRGWKATQPKKGKICVICPHAGVKEVLKLAALDKVWDIVDDMTDARAIVGARHSGGSSSGGSSSGAGVWIIGVILLIACGALVVFAVNPELLGIKNAKEETPAEQSEPSSEDSEAASNTNPEKDATPESDESTEKSAPEKTDTPKEDNVKKDNTEKKPAEPEKKAAAKPKEEKAPESKPEAKTEPEGKPKPETKPEPK